jgi:hypothetical protein
MLGSSWVAAQLAASQKGLSSITKISISICVHLTFRWEEDLFNYCWEYKTSAIFTCLENHSWLFSNPHVFGIPMLSAEYKLENVYRQKSIFHFPSQICSKHLSCQHLKYMQKHMSSSKLSFLFFSFKQNWKAQTNFIKFINMKFHKNPFSSTQIVSCMQNDRRTDGAKSTGTVQCSEHA